MILELTFRVVKPFESLVSVIWMSLKFMRCPGFIEFCKTSVIMENSCWSFLDGGFGS